MVSEVEVLDLNVLLLPVVQLLVKIHDFLSESFEFLHIGESIDFKLEEVEENVHKLRLMCKSNNFRFHLVLHLHLLQFNVVLVLRLAFSLLLHSIKNKIIRTAI